MGMLRAAGQGVESTVRPGTAHLIAWLALPDEVRLALPGIGKCVARARILSRAEAKALSAGVSVNPVSVVACADEVAWVTVEAGLAAAVVAHALGLPASAIGAPLTRVERGVLTGVLAAVLVRLELTPVIRVAADAPVESAATGLAFSVDFEGYIGHVWLLTSDAFVAALVGALPALSRGTAISLEMAATDVLPADLAHAEVGDTVVFDGMPAVAADETWPVTVRRRTQRLSARWHPDGAVDLDEAARAAALDFIPDAPQSEPAAPAIVDVRAVSDGEVVAFAGASRPVFERDGLLVLEADGRPWARGAVSSHRGAFAVTITAKLAGPADLRPAQRWRPM